MAASTYAGVAGVNRKLTQIPVGVGGVNRNCKSAWAGVAGVNRQVFASGTPLSSKAVGSIVKIRENGALVDIYVACHNYEQSLNGAGRTLVVRKDCYDNREWHSLDVNAYATSSIDSWLNGTYKNMLDTDIQTLIGPTKFYYTPGNGNWTVGTLERTVFALSATELGRSSSWFNVEGSALPIASTLKIAYLNGSANTQWTRFPRRISTYNVMFLRSNGEVYLGDCTDTFGSRPAFTLPSSILLNDNNEIIGS